MKNIYLLHDEGSIHSKERVENREYKRLIQTLVTRYNNDMDTFEDNDVAMKEKLEHLERLVSEILAAVKHK